MGSVAHFLQQGSLLVALSQLSATRYVQVFPPSNALPVALVDVSLTTSSFLDSTASFWYRSSRWRGGRHCPVLLS